MKKEITTAKENTQSSVPGVGIAGEVICPIMSIGRIGGAPCVKHMCELWTELVYDEGTPQERKVARCALAWIPITATHTNKMLKNLNEVVHE